jgi:hypothetical protein
MALNIIKLAVGATDIPDLIDWQRRQIVWRREAGLSANPVCNTRMTPKRAADVVDGGSLYWVIKGVILVRQRIVRVESIEENGTSRCEFILDPVVHRTEPRARKAFQGWRYLEPADSPKDLSALGPGGEDLPPDLAAQLVELGAW